MDAPASPSEAASSSIVKLNVGGKKYVTTLSTLQLDGVGNFFTALLGGSFTPARDDKGYVFIDRDPAYFECILQFLRTGKLHCSPPLMKDVLMAELEFYGFDECQVLEKDRQFKKEKGRNILNYAAGFSGKELSEYMAYTRQAEVQDRFADFKELADLKHHIFFMLSVLATNYPDPPYLPELYLYLVPHPDDNKPFATAFELNYKHLHQEQVLELSPELINFIRFQKFTGRISSTMETLKYDLELSHGLVISFHYLLLNAKTFRKIETTPPADAAGVGVCIRFKPDDLKM